MNQTAKNVLSTFIVVALVGLGITLFLQRTSSRSGSGSGIGPSVGEEAPEFSLRRVESDEMVSLSEYRGRTVLLDFWATWCPPCREQMPVVQKLADDPKLSETLMVISVNADDAGGDRQAKVTKYLETNGYTFTTVMDDGRAMSAYGVSFLPTLVIVAPDGAIAYRENGVHTEAKLREMLDNVAK